MRYVKHFIKVAKGHLSRIGCKHEETYSASCPFTELTYTNCKKCLKRIRIEKTV
jgi:hypothetical protein